ncbi:hypothetical protein, partial [Brevundimonas sp.]|uniref:hypothetical protein n=1 Tax=Brevundimonas sp. TaxID=1871086 RepID=UPI003918F5E7
ETALLEERAEREAALLANPLAPNVAKRVAKEDRKRKIRGKTKKGRRERDPYGCTVEPGEPLPDTAVPLARTAGRHGQADFRRATFPYQAGARK